MSTTLIRCKAHRNGGTKINDLFGKNYHFKPAIVIDGDKMDDKEIPHVCAIPNEEAQAIHRLLSIKDHFELADPDAAIPAKPKAEPGQTIGAPEPEGPKDVIIKGGDGKEINLSELARDNPEELRVLARDEFGISLRGKNTNDQIINKIIEAMRASAAE